MNSGFENFPLLPKYFWLGEVKDKGEMRGSLHFGGKSAASGRDDASWVEMTLLGLDDVAWMGCRGDDSRDKPGWSTIDEDTFYEEQENHAGRDGGTGDS